MLVPKGEALRKYYVYLACPAAILAFLERKVEGHSECYVAIFAGVEIWWLKT